MKTIAAGILFSLGVLRPAAPLLAQAAGGVEQQARSHSEKAQAFLRDKRPDLAIPELRALVTLEPANASALGDLGVLLFFNGDYAGAVPPLRAALNLQPRLWKIQALLGISERRTDDLAAARADLEAAFPQLAGEKKIQIEAGMGLVEIYSGSGDLDRAAETVAALRQVEPTDPRVLYAAYRIAADQAGEAMLSLSMAAPDSAQMHQAIAHELEKARDTPAVIANLRKAEELDPALPGVHFELAEALRQADGSSQRAEAEQQYRQALAQDPRDHQSACALGDLTAARGDMQAATAFYRQALAINPRSADAMVGLAYVSAQQGDVKTAAPMLERAINIDPANTMAHYRLSAVYRRQGRIDDARRELETYQHYKAMKERMRAIYRNLRETPPVPAVSTARPER